jgi:hypothetical protein
MSTFKIKTASGWVRVAKKYLGIGKDILQAKGDLIVAAQLETPDRLPVGTDGQVLVADSASPLGVKWENPSSSGSAQTSVGLFALDGLVGEMIPTFSSLSVTKTMGLYS